MAALGCSVTVNAQCPVNIGFELGDFTNWKCAIGSVYASGTVNTITVNTSAPTANRQVIINKSTNVDPYGGFSISPPDGSNYALKLGNDAVGAQAEQVSYLINVPTSQANFTITYQYAVVLEDPGHTAAQQPRFQAKVYDVTDSTYITCGSFDYVATANLPGFKKNSGDVIYKAWTPVTLNLAGYQGKQLRLEFTTADCTLGGHFGYAYVDVNNVCNNLIQGATYCTGSSSVVLNGPAGFQTYTWYNYNQTVTLGTSSSLVLTPPPPDGTSVVLSVVPYAGFGCPNTIQTTIHAIPGVKTFKVTDPPYCQGSSVDITTPNITLGSDTNLNYTYWQDVAATIPVSNPKAITTSGVYYISAAASSLCSIVKPVNVYVNTIPSIVITNPPTSCPTSPVDITSPAIVAGSTTGLSYTYWLDSLATKPLSAPTKVSQAGTYFIMGITAKGCSQIKPVKVTFYPAPIVITHNPAPVCFPATINLTDSVVTQGSDAKLNFSYWADSTATTPLISPKAIGTSGIYYIKGTNANGCYIITKVTVVINPLPNLVITNPPGVCAPGTIDITASAVTQGSTGIANLTYWKNYAATKPLANPNAVADSGQYYIKATNSQGCFTMDSVVVTIHATPRLVITPPRKKYIPQTTDVTSLLITKGSSAGLTFSYWQDAAYTIPLTNPKSIKKSTTVYIKAVNTNGCTNTDSIPVVIAPVPDIKVPTAFTPTKSINNTLYPFLIGIKSFTAFRVYNKWGNIVFQTNNVSPAAGWDGTYKGQPAILDTYTWVAEGYDYLDVLVHRSGNTILLK